jgi:hypothetical protein
VKFFLVVIGLISLVVACSKSTPPEEPKPDFVESKKSNEFVDIQTLPYLETVEKEINPDLKGVTKYIPELADRGYTVYTILRATRANLISMEGKIVHSWQAPSNSAQEQRRWSRGLMNDLGELFVIVEGKTLMKLDWYSNLLWEAEVDPHHDLALAENGDVYVLAGKLTAIEGQSPAIYFLDNQIVILSGQGKIKQEISLYQSVKNIPTVKNKIQKYIAEYDPRKIISGKKRADSGFVFNRFQNTRADLFHANSIVFTQKSRPGLWCKGDLLISIRNLNLLVVLDGKTYKPLWYWGDQELDAQHSASFLANGDILLFDNGVKSKRSRVIKVDPGSKKIVWEYLGNPPDSFFSLQMGASQKLANGNILITNSASGQLLEITADKQVVWEYLTPAFGKGKRAIGKKKSTSIKKNKRRAIYRAQRISSQIVDRLLEK